LEVIEVKDTDFRDYNQSRDLNPSLTYQEVLKQKSKSDKEIRRTILLVLLNALPWLFYVIGVAYFYPE
jgi:hypothetical protein